jgi:prepilin-type processing-associated H-X9-DG protein
MTDYMPIAVCLINPLNASGNSLQKTTIGPTDLGALRVPASDTSAISDGLSTTIVMVEDVGRSEFFFELGAAGFTDPLSTVTGASPGLLPATTGHTRNSFRWAEPASSGTVSGPPGSTFASNGSISPITIVNNNFRPFGGPVTLSYSCPWTTTNCGPSEEPFSFHGGGINALFVDAHVSFIAQEIDPVAFRRLLTAQEGLPSSYVDQ